MKKVFAIVLTLALLASLSVTSFAANTTEGATLAYTITAGGNAVSGGGVVAEFDTDKLEQAATIHIAAADPDYAGEYKDTVTFTVAVKTN